MLIQNSIKLLLVASTLFLSISSSYSNEIKATVTVNDEILDINARNLVSDFAYQIENYFNSTRFTDIDWEGEPINANVLITFSGGGNGVYSARMFVEAQRPTPDGGTSPSYRGVEEDWRFEYANGAIQTYDRMRFDPLASILDFYALTMIGFELDSYYETGGNPAFNLARQIVTLGGSKRVPGFEMTAAPGEYNKYNLINELTDPRYEDFRLYVYDYYNSGLDIMKEDEEIAMLNLRDIVMDMKDFKDNRLSGPSVLMQVWFDTKALELAALFSGFEEDTILDMLRQLDPSNGQIYGQAKK
ncbi:MAG: DUF4835 family protein [Candidatus Kapaibacteriales bacterium]